MKHCRHLNQIQLTADGNHHSNKYIKNNDPNDVSLYNGQAYFPNDADYREYIEGLSNTLPEVRHPSLSFSIQTAHELRHQKTTCNHLAAINKQNRKKFKNMDVTGIVNIQCSHVFIKSSVDLQLGEKYVRMTVIS
jgi:hypothetical protein